MSQLEQRLGSIEQRLSRIEKSLSISTPAASAPPAAIAAKVGAPPPVPEARPGNWLGIIAVICFVLAAGFIIKLSIQSGWLTPARQIGLAALLGMSLIASGLGLMRADREYASLLPGAGVIVLYLTAFAAHLYYGLVTFEVALALTSLVSALCVWLYISIRHDAYAITAAIGAYVSPVIMGFHSQALFSMYYFLLCSFAFATISINVKSRTLTVISAYLAIVMTGVIGIGLEQDVLVASMLGLHFLVFSGGLYLYSTHHHMPMSEGESWSFFPILLIFYALEYYFVDRIQPGLAPWISLGFAAFLIGLYLAAKKQFPDGLGSQSLILAFATIAVFHSVYIELLPDDIRPWLFVGIMLAGALSPFDLSAPRSGPFRLPVLAICLVLAIEYLTMVSHLLHGGEPAWLVVSLAGFASLWLVLVLGDGKPGQRSYGYVLLGAAHVLAILGFYRLTTDSGSLAVSASWLFYAVAVMAFAFSRKDEVMAKSALFVLGFAAAKALLYDAASAATIVRILCLLLTGAVLYGCGFLMRRIARWEKP